MQATNKSYLGVFTASYDGIPRNLASFHENPPGRRFSINHPCSTTSKNEEYTRSAIYNLIKPTHLFGKYTGIAPLNGYFECQALPRQLRFYLVGIFLPLAAISSQSYAFFVLFDTMFRTLIAERSNIFENLEIITVAFIFCFFNIAVTILTCLREGKLRKHISLYDGIRNLYKDGKEKLKKRIVQSYIIFIAARLLRVFLYMTLLHQFFAGQPMSNLTYSIYVIGFLLLFSVPLHINAFFMTFAFVIYHGFKKVNSRLQKLEPTTNERRNARDIRALFDKYLYLCYVTEDFNRVMSPTVLIMLTFVASSCCQSSYMFVAMIKQKPEEHISVVIVMLMIVPEFVALLGFCNAAHKAEKEAASVATVIFSPTLTNNPTYRKEIEMFAYQLDYIKIQLKIYQFLPLNRSLATAIVSVVVSYCFLMFQLQD